MKRGLTHRVTTVLSICMMTILVTSEASFPFNRFHHKDATTIGLAAVGFSTKAITLLSFFNWEVDLTDLEEYVAKKVGERAGRELAKIFICKAEIDSSLEIPTPFGNFRLFELASIDLGNWPRCQLVTSVDFQRQAHNFVFHTPSNQGLFGFTQVLNHWKKFDHVNPPPSNSGDMSPCPDRNSSAFLGTCAVHPQPGASCVDTLERFGWAVHAIQDFYSHSNWVEVFHGYRRKVGPDEYKYIPGAEMPFEKIPTWDEFMKNPARYNLTREQLDERDGDLQLLVTHHDLWQKDSIREDQYENDNKEMHKDSHDGNLTIYHTFIDYHRAAKNLAIRATREWGQKLKENILNNPKLGKSFWNELQDCEPPEGFARYADSLMRLENLVVHLLNGVLTIPIDIPLD